MKTIFNAIALILFKEASWTEEAKGLKAPAGPLEGYDL